MSLAGPARRVSSLLLRRWTSRRRFGRGELLETGDPRLLKILPHHPGGVQFGVGQPVCRQHSRHFSVGVPPMPDWNGQAGEDEMAGVARAGAGRAGLVEVAQIHGGPALDGAKKKRLGLGALGSEGRAAWRLSADAQSNLFRGEAGVNKGLANGRVGSGNRGRRDAVCGLGAAWINRRAAGHGFDQAPTEGAGVDRMRRVRSGAGRRGGRLAGGQEGFRKHQVASFKPFTFVVRIVV